MLLRVILILISFSSAVLYAKEIPIVVISAGKSVQSYNIVGSDIEIIDSEALEKSEHNFLGDILDSAISGANYFQNGGTGTTAGIQLRGLPKRYSTVYIDGVKMSDPSTSDNSFYISNIMKDTIERVEILKGSQSSLYGSSAIGGTINIFTKKGREGKHKKYDILKGSNGTTNLSASFDGADKNHDFYIGFSKFVTDGISAMNDASDVNDDDSYTNQGVVGNYGYKFNNNISFRSSLRFNDSFLNYDEVAAGRTDANNTTDDTELTYNLSLKYENGKFKNTLVYNKTDIERATKTYINAPKNYFGYRDAINLIGEYNFNLDTKVVFGLDNEFDQAKFQKDWPEDYLKSDESIHSQYLDFQFRPLEKLYSTIGFRRDDHTTAGDYTTGRATLAYKLDNFSKIRASYGTGIRFPALYDYFYGTVVTTKEDLKPEKSKSFDIGYESNFKKINTSFDISAYRITYEDALEGWESHGWTIKNATGQVESKGIELSSLWIPRNNFNIGLNYSYSDTYDGADCDDPDKGTNCIDEAMVRVPRHAVTSAIIYKTKNNLNNKILIKYSGEIRDYGNTNNSFADQILDDYITFNYFVDYKLYDQYKVYFSASNIFDQNYEQAYQYSTMGRSFNFGLKIEY